MRKKSAFGTSHAFLLEIILNILLFAVLLSVSLQLIMKAHSLTNETQVTYQAVDFCDNIASLYESGDGSLDVLSASYPMGTLSDSAYRLGLEKDFEPITPVQASSDAAGNTGSDETQAYTLTVTLPDPTSYSFTGSAANIVLTDSDNEVVYSVRACHFTQATAAGSEVEK